jgi:AcrR family transcriptional regulator
MPRQDRARATRECILRAAAQEFERAGFVAASLRAMLARVGVTKGAFYFHFESKEAVAAERGLTDPEAPNLYAEWERTLGEWLREAEQAGLLRPGVDVAGIAQVLKR